MVDRLVSPTMPIEGRSKRLARFPHLREAILASEPAGVVLALAALRMPRIRMAFCALVLGVGLGACGDTERLSRATSVEAEVEQRDVQASCTECSVTFGPEIVIGAREDHYLDYPLVGVVVDWQGHIIVASLNRVQEFNPDGEIVGSIGRTGDGPGEFTRPLGVAVGPSDSLFVFHSRGVSVFDREGEFARQVAFPRPPSGALRLESGEFVSATPFGRGQNGSTVYLYDSQWERRAYGAEVGQVPSNSALAGPISVGAASGGSFWIAARAPYRLERWTSAGELELVLEPSADHFPLREDTQIVGGGRRVTVNTPYVVAVAEDREGRLWTSVAELVEEREGDLPPSGRRYESVIEVMDSRTGDLLGTGRVRGLVTTIQPDGHLIATWEAPTGELLLIARRARLEPAGETNR